jgi:hypothetical protein
MARYPQELGRGEAGHRQIAGDLMQFRRPLSQLGAFVDAAHVVPQNGRAQDTVLRVKQHRAVHLAGQANAAHLREFVGVLRAQRGQGGSRAVPPVGGILFGPALMRARNGERRTCRADDAAVGREQQDFYFGRAEVDAEIHGRGTFVVRDALL